jgi:hypothetical protein
LEHLKIRLCLQEKWEQVLEKGGKISKKFVEPLDGRGTKRSDLDNKENILGSS